jgi:hypothetical protein
MEGREARTLTAFTLGAPTDGLVSPDALLTLTHRVEKLLGKDVSIDR